MKDYSDYYEFAKTKFPVVEYSTLWDKGTWVAYKNGEVIKCESSVAARNISNLVKCIKDPEMKNLKEAYWENQDKISSLAENYGMMIFGKNIIACHLNCSTCAITLRMNDTIVVGHDEIANGLTGIVEFAEECIRIYKGE